MTADGVSARAQNAAATNAMAKTTVKREPQERKSRRIIRLMLGDHPVSGKAIVIRRPSRIYFDTVLDFGRVRADSVICQDAGTCSPFSAFCGVGGAK